MSEYSVSPINRVWGRQSHCDQTLSSEVEKKLIALFI
jgi:hypothetical protein